MVNPTLTQWFPVSHKPARPGVYNVSCQDQDQSGKWYSYWDGKGWTYFGEDPDEALEYFDNYASRFQGFGSGCKGGTWRGLAHDPATKELTQ